VAVRPVLLYDADCRFCRSVARTLVRLDRNERVAFLPLGDTQVPMLLPGFSESERAASIHLVEPGGQRLARGAALARLLTELGLPAPAARLLGHLYGPVANRRSILGRVVPDGPAPRRYP
jgi:predicted DCC family thiol-disulfide oxidoreductase YuxK